MPGKVIYEAHPAMFQAHPFLFIISVLLIPVFGLGILILLYWFIRTRMTTLYVTDHEIMFEQGILSKDRMAVSLRHVRLVRVTQSFFNRILGVGTIEISTAGDMPEFAVRDMPHPHEIREAIRRAQRMEAEATQGGGSV
jgi:uncharacterized membrane protein YdbT with pleckstrin-like domain